MTTPLRHDLKLDSGEAWLQPDFTKTDEADQWLKTLDATIDWQQDRIRMFGRDIPAPRLTAWYGDVSAYYSYSGLQLIPKPWTPLLQDIRERIQAATGHTFNAVLVNRYQDGQHGMGYHADDEPELGPNPVIASLSLGATRTMRFKPRKPSSGPSVAVPLTHGSLLLMAGETQHAYLHAIPKTKKACGPRINLTFRFVHPRH